MPIDDLNPEKSYRTCLFKSEGVDVFLLVDQFAGLYLMRYFMSRKNRIKF